MMRRIGVLFALAALGCGSDDSGPPPAEGTQGGACRAGGGCDPGLECTATNRCAQPTGPSTGGDLPAVPAQGAATAAISPIAGDTACPYSGPPISAPSGAVQEIAQGADGARVIDGEGATVRCTVSGNATFAVSGSIEAMPGFTFSVDVAALALGGSATATIRHFSSNTGAVLESAECVIDLTGKFVDSGAIWADYDCPRATDGALGACSLSGTFIFENCAR